MFLEGGKEALPFVFEYSPGDEKGLAKGLRCPWVRGSTLGFGGSDTHNLDRVGTAHARCVGLLTFQIPLRLLVFREEKPKSLKTNVRIR
jgi:hypothetical protein